MNKLVQSLFSLAAAAGGILSLGLRLSFIIGDINLLYYLFFRCDVAVLSASQKRSIKNSIEDPLIVRSNAIDRNSSALKLSNSRLVEAIKKARKCQNSEISLD
jgi:hypothetical protein